MKILSISAQKPGETGSGIVFGALIRAFAAQGHEQAAVAGIAQGDRVSLPEGVAFYPVIFETPRLPFPVVGMSDEMPYPSTRYRDLTPEMEGQFREAFLRVIRQAVEALKPDLILCHHLYLLTALVRDAFPGHVVSGICHNTDLRQMEKTDLERDMIRCAIRRLDHIYVLKRTQMAEVERIYRAPAERINLIGMGYNKQIFYPRGGRQRDGKTRIIFVGKIAEKKGVFSLLRCLDHLRPLAERLEVLMVGGAGNEEEYRQALALAERAPVPVKFCGSRSQEELAELYSACDIFALPSYYEGIPLTLLEALACGARAVVSDLPGLREWMDEFVPHADVRYVALPAMAYADEPAAGELPGFERRLAQALEDCIHSKGGPAADLSRVSWEGIAETITLTRTAGAAFDNPPSACG